MTAILRAPVLAAALVALAAGDAAADEGRFSLSLRGGAFNRDDGGYADHAQVYGLSNPEVSGGGVLEGGVRVLPRLWLLASWSGFTSSGPRRLSELSVTSSAVLAQVGFTAWREEFATGEFPWSMRLELTAGGGYYTISDQLDGEGRRDRAPGARVGAQVGASWKAVGLVLSYGWHMTGARLEDRLGGTLGAGGHEIGGGLRFEF
ncbi:MAG TPA: hypothetical protein VFU21_26655 [Kofleriaceae bacterium]|nr:hypothetical protein [Kofleriaceae bacterium]